jgi:hypothetical protein
LANDVALAVPKLAEVLKFEDLTPETLCGFVSFLDISAWATCAPFLAIFCAPRHHESLTMSLICLFHHSDSSDIATSRYGNIFAPSSSWFESKRPAFLPEIIVLRFNEA